MYIVQDEKNPQMYSVPNTISVAGCVAACSRDSESNKTAPLEGTSKVLMSYNHVFLIKLATMLYMVTLSHVTDPSAAWQQGPDVSMAHQ